MINWEAISKRKKVLLESLLEEADVLNFDHECRHLEQDPADGTPLEPDKKTGSLGEVWRSALPAHEGGLLVPQKLVVVSQGAPSDGDADGATREPAKLRIGARGRAERQRQVERLRQYIGVVDATCEDLQTFLNQSSTGTVLDIAQLCSDDAPAKRKQGGEPSTTAAYMKSLDQLSGGELVVDELIWQTLAAHVIKYHAWCKQQLRSFLLEPLGEEEYSPDSPKAQAMALSDAEDENTLAGLEDRLQKVFDQASASRHRGKGIPLNQIVAAVKACLQDENLDSRGRPMNQKAKTTPTVDASDEDDGVERMEAGEADQLAARMNLCLQETLAQQHRLLMGIFAMQEQQGDGDVDMPDVHDNIKEVLQNTAEIAKGLHVMGTWVSDVSAMRIVDCDEGLAENARSTRLADRSKDRLEAELRQEEPKREARRGKVMKRFQHCADGVNRVVAAIDAEVKKQQHRRRSANGNSSGEEDAADAEDDTPKYSVAELVQLSALSVEQIVQICHPGMDKEAAAQVLNAEQQSHVPMLPAATRFGSGGFHAKRTAGEGTMIEHARLLTSLRGRKATLERKLQRAHDNLKFKLGRVVSKDVMKEGKALEEAEKQRRFEMTKKLQDYRATQLKIRENLESLKHTATVELKQWSLMQEVQEVSARLRNVKAVHKVKVETAARLARELDDVREVVLGAARFCAGAKIQPVSVDPTSLKLEKAPWLPGKSLKDVIPEISRAFANEGCPLPAGAFSSIIAEVSNISAELRASFQRQGLDGSGLRLRLRQALGDAFRAGSRSELHMLSLLNMGGRGQPAPTPSSDPPADGTAASNDARSEDEWFSAWQAACDGLQVSSPLIVRPRAKLTDIDFAEDIIGAIGLQEPQRIEQLPRFFDGMVEMKTQVDGTRDVARRMTAYLKQAPAVVVTMVNDGTKTFLEAGWQRVAAYIAGEASAALERLAAEFEQLRGLHSSSAVAWPLLARQESTHLNRVGNVEEPSSRFFLRGGALKWASWRILVCYQRTVAVLEGVRHMINMHRVVTTLGALLATAEEGGGKVTYKDVRCQLSTLQRQGLRNMVLVGTVSLCSWAEDMQREASQKGPLWTEVSKVVGMVTELIQGATLPTLYAKHSSLVQSGELYAALVAREEEIHEHLRNTLDLLRQCIENLRNTTLPLSDLLVSGCRALDGLLHFWWLEAALLTCVSDGTTFRNWRRQMHRMLDTGQLRRSMESKRSGALHAELVRFEQHSPRLPTAAQLQDWAEVLRTECQLFLNSFSPAERAGLTWVLGSKDLACRSEDPLLAMCRPSLLPDAAGQCVPILWGFTCFGDVTLEDAALKGFPEPEPLEMSTPSKGNLLGRFRQKGQVAATMGALARASSKQPTGSPTKAAGKVGKVASTLARAASGKKEAGGKKRQRKSKASYSDPAGDAPEDDELLEDVEEGEMAYENEELPQSEEEVEEQVEATQEVCIASKTYDAAVVEDGVGERTFHWKAGESPEVQETAEEAGTNSQLEEMVKRHSLEEALQMKVRSPSLKRHKTTGGLEMQGKSPRDALALLRSTSFLEDDGAHAGQSSSPEQDESEAGKVNNGYHRSRSATSETEKESVPSSLRSQATRRTRSDIGDIDEVQDTEGKAEEDSPAQGGSWWGEIQSKRKATIMELDAGDLKLSIKVDEEEERMLQQILVPELLFLRDVAPLSTAELQSFADQNLDVDAATTVWNTAREQLQRRLADMDARSLTSRKNAVKDKKQDLKEIKKLRAGLTTHARVLATKARQAMVQQASTLEGQASQYELKVQGIMERWRRFDSAHADQNIYDDRAAMPFMKRKSILLSRLAEHKRLATELEAAVEIELAFKRKALGNKQAQAQMAESLLWIIEQTHSVPEAALQEMRANVHQERQEMLHYQAESIAEEQQRLESRAQLQQEIVDEVQALRAMMMSLSDYEAMVDADDGVEDEDVTAELSSDDEAAQQPNVLSQTPQDVGLACKLLSVRKWKNLRKRQARAVSMLDSIAEEEQKDMQVRLDDVERGTAAMLQLQIEISEAKLREAEEKALQATRVARRRQSVAPVKLSRAVAAPAQHRKGKRRSLLATSSPVRGAPKRRATFAVRQGSESFKQLQDKLSKVPEEQQRPDAGENAWQSLTRTRHRANTESPDRIVRRHTTDVTPSSPRVSMVSRKSGGAGSPSVSPRRSKRGRTRTTQAIVPKDEAAEPSDTPSRSLGDLPGMLESLQEHMADRTAELSGSSSEPDDDHDLEEDEGDEEQAAQERHAQKGLIDASIAVAAKKEQLFAYQLSLARTKEQSDDVDTAEEWLDRTLSGLEVKAADLRNGEVSARATLQRMILKNLELKSELVEKVGRPTTREDDAESKEARALRQSEMKILASHQKLVGIKTQEVAVQESISTHLANRLKELTASASASESTSEVATVREQLQASNLKLAMLKDGLKKAEDELEAAAQATQALHAMHAQVEDEADNEPLFPEPTSRRQSARRLSVSKLGVAAQSNVLAMLSPMVQNRWILLECFTAWHSEVEDSGTDDEEEEEEEEENEDNAEEEEEEGEAEEDVGPLVLPQGRHRKRSVPRSGEAELATGPDGLLQISSLQEQGTRSSFGSRNRGSVAPGQDEIKAVVGELLRRPSALRHMEPERDPQMGIMGKKVAKQPTLRRDAHSELASASSGEKSSAVEKLLQDVQVAEEPKPAGEQQPRKMVLKPGEVPRGWAPVPKQRLQGATALYEEEQTKGGEPDPQGWFTGLSVRDLHHIVDDSGAATTKVAKNQQQDRKNHPQDGSEPMPEPLPTLTQATNQAASRSAPGMHVRAVMPPVPSPVKPPRDLRVETVPRGEPALEYEGDHTPLSWALEEEEEQAEQEPEEEARPLEQEGVDDEIRCEAEVRGGMRRRRSSGFAKKIVYTKPRNKVTGSLHQAGAPTIMEGESDEEDEEATALQFGSLTIDVASIQVQLDDKDDTLVEDEKHRHVDRETSATRPKAWHKAPLLQHLSIAEASNMPELSLLLGPEAALADPAQPVGSVKLGRGTGARSERHDPGSIADVVSTRSIGHLTRSPPPTPGTLSSFETMPPTRGVQNATRSPMLPVGEAVFSPPKPPGRHVPNAPCPQPSPRLKSFKPLDWSASDANPTPVLPPNYKQELQTVKGRTDMQRDGTGVSLPPIHQVHLALGSSVLKTAGVRFSDGTLPPGKPDPDLLHSESYLSWHLHQLAGHVAGPKALAVEELHSQRQHQQQGQREAPIDSDEDDLDVQPRAGRNVVPPCYASRGPSFLSAMQPAVDTQSGGKEALQQRMKPSLAGASTAASIEDLSIERVWQDALKELDVEPAFVQ